MRFNFNFRQAPPAPICNHEGAPAYVLTPALELYAAVATAALSDQFYETADTRLARLRALVAKNEPQFVARLAVYARERLCLRSVPLVLAVELARIHQGDNLVSRLVVLAFNKFDAYQLAKDNRDGAVRLRDARFLVHPQPRDEGQQAVFDQLVAGTLPTPYT